MHDYDPFTTSPPNPDYSRPAPREASSAEPPRRIGRYRVEKILGDGGFGRVYLAHDDELNRPVAIKVPHQERVSGPEDVESYLAEARVLASLDHPHIVPVFDLGRTDDGLCFVVSKFIEGSDLAKTLKEARFAFAESAKLVANVADALHHAHRKGLVHRDVKPGNILLDVSGKPYLADFGLALKEEDFGRGPGFAGTPLYMSPEQARGEGHRVDGRSDLFSLGVVFYELLAGRRPFHGETRSELLEQIVSVEARPPRMIDDTVPKELERICLKALAKRASERYTTAKDMAEDLRHFLGVSVSGEPSGVSRRVSVDEGEPSGVSRRVIVDDTRRLTPLGSPGSPATPTNALASTPPPAKIVPKGLRSFDADDADFFLELLPGPRDRDGLPDSVRFWKGRVEQTDADRTFAVGLIYGPSGCGKSSLVKAGLLPRLAGHVRAVYVEATAEETEARLLKGLGKQCPGLPENLALVDSAAALRRGRGLATGQKVLVVLDQFEQWLHARRAEENTQLVQALRHCDGARVQCIVLVRDDFWLAASRFFQTLEIRLVEGDNSALVDLFDQRHATKVLAAFGGAFGAVPEHPVKEQEEFLTQAVAGLSQDGKVISVRLALFAEMVKGKPWNPVTLKEVGGTEGVGVTFLEETFSASTAPPAHRVHQKAARSLLKALLPETGTDIKGNMRSGHDLLAASGYADRPKDFDALLRILDGELRLVTPTDPEGNEGADDLLARRASKGCADPLLARRANECTDPLLARRANFFQLTHDYLVPSLREWLTRKQRETRRGRAELRLAERAAAWNAKPESRHLPAWWEWANIRLLTRKREWTPQQRKMMSKAGRFHGLCALGLVVAVAALTLLGLFVSDRVTEKNKEIHAGGLVQQLLRAETAQVPEVVEKLEGYRSWADPLLRQEMQQAAPDSPERLHASMALLPVDEGQVDYLYQRMLDAEPAHLVVIREFLAGHKEALTGKLWDVLGDERQDADRRFRAACALAGYDSAASERWRKVSPFVTAHLLVSVQKNPSHYTPLLEALRPIRGELVDPLSKVFRGKERSDSERSWATNILADYAADRPDVLARLLMDAEEKQFAVLFPKLGAHRERALPALGETVKTTLESRKTDAAKETLAKRQANAAAALLRLGDAVQAWPLLSHRSDPRARSYLIHRLAPLGIDPGMLVARLEEEKEVSIRRALLLSLGEFGLDRLPLGEREKLIPRVIRLYEEDPDAGLHASVEWLLRWWKREDLLKEGVRGWMKDKAARDARQDTVRRELKAAKPAAPMPAGKWYVNGQGQTMVVIPGPVTFRMGSPLTEAGREGGPKGRIETPHQKRIGRTFAIAAHEVTVEQFQRFRKDHEYNDSYSPTKDHPINLVTWYDAAAYCNWLSEQEGIPEGQWCYEPMKDRDISRVVAGSLAGTIIGNRSNNPLTSVAAVRCARALLPSEQPDKGYGVGMKLKKNYLSLDGYRLPSEAEWEYACRAGAATSRYHGESEELLGKYAWYTKNSQDRGMLPPGSLKPNDLGLFDMLGNALEWCQERVLYYNADLVMNNDKEDIRDISSTHGRVLRGGAFSVHAVFVRSADRVRFGPADRGNNVGFRPARTFR